MLLIEVLMVFDRLNVFDEDCSKGFIFNKGGISLYKNQYIKWY